MGAVQELLLKAQGLSTEDRERLIEALEMTLARCDDKEHRGTQGPYSQVLKMACKVESEFSDVSADKYKHLAQVYACKEQDL